MAFQTVFERVELKYILTREQKETVLREIGKYMSLDRYGRSVIRNLYFDTDSYLLIRRSIDKPVYKEKLRIRSYEKVSPGGGVFVELKKKYDRIVYKRRLHVTEEDAISWMRGGQRPNDTQIAREIEYFRDLYGGLHPTAFLSYEREAYYMRDGTDFRVTFDDNILCRTEDLSLESEVYGTLLLPPDRVLMEIKCSGGMPLWMAHLLSREHIYKTSFSKYGTAYRELILPNIRNNKENTDKKEFFSYV